MRMGTSNANSTAAIPLFSFKARRNKRRRPVGRLGILSWNLPKGATAPRALLARALNAKTNEKLCAPLIIVRLIAHYGMGGDNKIAIRVAEEFAHNRSNDRPGI